MVNSGSNSDSIDAVISWVDGSDPVHRRKREQASNDPRRPSKRPIAAGRIRERFQDNGELQYCIASIGAFAPWVRTIHLITDNQRPHFLSHELTEKYAIKIVDHSEIFHQYEWALPTFNSATIETAMWRIPGLSHRFIYFNDDLALLQPVTPQDFFLDDKVICRGAWSPSIGAGGLQYWSSQFLSWLSRNMMGINRTMHLLRQRSAARLAGMRYVYFRTQHTPHPIRVSTLQDYFYHYPANFENNVRFPFRDASQFLPVSLAYHLELMRGSGLVRDESDLLTVDVARDSESLLSRKIDMINHFQFRFLCLSDLGGLSARLRNRLHHTLCDAIGIDPQDESLFPQ